MEFLSLPKILESVKTPHEYIILENFFSEGRNFNEMKLFAFDTAEEVVAYILKGRMSHMDLETLEDLGGISYSP